MVENRKAAVLSQGDWMAVKSDIEIAQASKPYYIGKVAEGLIWRAGKTAG